MKKVIYFDEGSATDFMSIINDGDLIKEIIDSKNKVNASNVDGNAEISTGKGIKKIFDLLIPNLNASAEININAFREKSALISSTITNTILTDFLNYVQKSSKDIKKMKGYKLIAVENSIAYFQQFSPYFIMTDGKMQLDIEEDINFNLNKVHDALKTGKGYYELLASKKSVNNKIFRFNNKEFKNNYSISDLLQMNLVFYGIKVGRMHEELLDFNIAMERYVNVEDKNKDMDLAQKILNEIKVIDNECIESCDNEKIIRKKELDVYDIILAGVE